MHRLERIYQINMKNKYPLPLIASAFESVHCATVFTEVDLHDGCQLVCTGQVEWKTTF